MRPLATLALIFLISSSLLQAQENAWIRINMLGYTPSGIKVAIWCGKVNESISEFSVIDSISGKTVFTSKAGTAFGAYGPFSQTYRLNFSSFKKPGIYCISAGGAKSPYFSINNDVYKGAAVKGH